MQYRKLGNTGFDISAVGFGAMRLPEYEKDGKWYMDEETSVKAVHTAFELGVNYIDTAWGYSNENNQYLVGKAIKGWRDKIKLSTKLPIWLMKKEDDFWQLLEEQLRRLDVDRIDFYHLHALDKDRFENLVLGLNVLDNMEKAKQQGLIAHKSFSFHDKPEVMKPIIDTGAFETVLCQYNLLDRSNEQMIDYAAGKGLGVIVMGPVAGGRLAAGSEVLQNMVKSASGTPEIALRFVLANKNVSCALSGMENITMVEENVEIGNRSADELSADEWKQIAGTLEEMKALSDLYCTGCDYCQPCPKDIRISKLFTFYNYHKIYGITDFAKNRFAKLGGGDEWGGDPKDCIDCGACVKKCPQGIKIPEKIREAVNALLK